MPPPTQMLTRSLVSARMSLEVEHQSSAVTEVVTGRISVGAERHPVKLAHANCHVGFDLGIYSATEHHRKTAAAAREATKAGRVMESAKQAVRKKTEGLVA